MIAALLLIGCCDVSLTSFLVFTSTSVSEVECDLETQKVLQMNWLDGLMVRPFFKNWPG